MKIFRILIWIKLKFSVSAAAEVEKKLIKMPFKDML